MRITLYALLALSAFTLATPASAAFYAFHVEGKVSGFSGEPLGYANLQTQFSVGQDVAITVVYDGDTAEGVSGPNTAVYPGAISSIDGAIGGYTFTRAASPSSNTLDLANGTSVGDELTAFVSIDGDPVGVASADVFFTSLNDADDTVFPGTFLTGAGEPPSLTLPLDFTQFDTADIALVGFLDPSFGEVNVDFTITSITNQAIPEPSSLALLGLGGLLASKRRSFTYRPVQKVVT